MPDPRPEAIPDDLGEVLPLETLGASAKSLDSWRARNEGPTTGQMSRIGLER